MEGMLKAGWNLFKAHWGTFLVFGAIVLVAVLWYDHKNGGKLTQDVAGLPIVGRIFA